MACSERASGAGKAFTAAVVPPNAKPDLLEHLARPLGLAELARHRVVDPEHLPVVGQERREMEALAHDRPRLSAGLGPVRTG